MLHMRHAPLLRLAGRPVSAVALGTLVTDAQILSHYWLRAKQEQLAAGRSAMEAAAFTPKQIAQVGIRINQDGTKRTPFELLAFPDVVFADVAKLSPNLLDISAPIQEQIARDALYANYIERQQKDVEKLRKDERHVIPHGFDYGDVSGLSTELKTKLERVRPADLAQAARIDGMTPAALALILGRIRYLEKKSA